MSLKPPRIVPYGDAALLIQYETDGFSKDVASAVQALATSLRANGYWDEIVPAYESILVAFNPAQTSMESAKRKLENKIINRDSASVKSGRLIEIPVCYAATYGPDMGNIMKSSGLSKKEIIKLHSDNNYLVCMMGFIPGFPFLSNVPAPLHHPRHETPRLKVPAGSVGIAGWQTGIYGLESPGGWQIIGRTPEVIFDKSRKAPFLIEAGDRVRFVPITAKAYEAYHA